MIRLFEMFAGYGGASFALKKAGIKYSCIGYSEIKPIAIKCFEQNFPEIKNYGDCTKINPNDIPDFDLLTGGFPCQDVSIIGKRDLSKGRTNLYKEILRIAKIKQPKYMLLENVKGLLSINKDRSLRDIIINDLNKIGYGVAFKCLNSKDFGIPQNRSRVWFVCKLGGWKFGEFHWPVERELQLTVTDLKERSPKEIEIKFLNEKHKKYEHAIEPQVSLCLVSKQIYALTKKTVIKHGEKLRYLIAKESFRLMGFFKDEIKLEGLSLPHCHELAGNGWDIHLASLLFKEMFKEEKNECKS